MERMKQTLQKWTGSKCRTYLVLVVSLVLIAATAVSPTFSWLSAQTDPVVNTFAGGAISLIVDEAPVGPDGVQIDGDRVTANRYKYVAGAQLDKDPTPTVLKGSDECYVFLCLENNLNDLFALNIQTDAWKQVAVSGNRTLYAYAARVNAEAAEADVVLTPLFTKVSVSEDLTAADIEALGEKTLCVTAYAVQTEALSVEAAVDLAVAQFLPEGTTATYPEIA